MDVEAITQAQLDAYNAQDLDAYCGFFTDDVVIADVGGAVSSTTNAALRERYAGAFAKFPRNRADLKNRIVLGNTVIDHEYVDRGDGVTAPFEVAAIYTFRGDKIARVDFAK